MLLDSLKVHSSDEVVHTYQIRVYSPDDKKIITLEKKLCVGCGRPPLYDIDGRFCQKTCCECNQQLCPGCGYNYLDYVSLRPRDPPGQNYYDMTYILERQKAMKYTCRTCCIKLGLQKVCSYSNDDGEKCPDWGKWICSSCDNGYCHEHHGQDKKCISCHIKEGKKSCTNCGWDPVVPCPNCQAGSCRYCYHDCPVVK